MLTYSGKLKSIYTKEDKWLDKDTKEEKSKTKYFIYIVTEWEWKVIEYFDSSKEKIEELKEWELYQIPIKLSNNYGISKKTWVAYSVLSYQFNNFWDVVSL